MVHWIRQSVPTATVVLLGFVCANTRAAGPTAVSALNLKPIQKDVDYDRPNSTEAAKCRLETETTPGLNGWIVRDAGGRLMRKFLDTNADKKIDLWCYFKNGVEVYRDIDGNANGKADQYRWLGTAGIRWGLDTNEDGKIDSWKMISAEEVTSEVVAALRLRDDKRFARLLLTISELKSLGVGAEQKAELQRRIMSAAGGFNELARRERVVDAQSKWIHFGASQPGVLPAGTDGSSKDIVIYDNVVAVVENAGKHGQVIIGTLVRVGDKWRVIGLPQNLVDSQTAATEGFFFHAALASRTTGEPAVASAGLSGELQELLKSLQAVEKSLASATTAKQRTELNGRRADVLGGLVDAALKPKDRKNWTRQFADTISAAVQSGEYPDGLKRLDAMHAKLSKDRSLASEAAYVKFRHMSAEYAQSLQKPKADYAKIQQKWLKDLEQFTKDYPESEDAPEAMIQLGLAQEFAGKEDDAKKWYRRIVAAFKSTMAAKKAAGAIARIESVGKSIKLSGQSLEGDFIDVSRYRGKVVLIHYWSTWCDQCKEEFRQLKDLEAKYGRRGFQPIGISLDNDSKQASRFLSTNRLPWPQLFESGGLDSRLANELGILTLPTMILIDKQGKVTRRNIHAAELDAELAKLLP